MSLLSSIRIIFPSNLGVVIAFSYFAERMVKVSSSLGLRFLEELLRELVKSRGMSIASRDNRGVLRSRIAGFLLEYSALITASDVL